MAAIIIKHFLFRILFQTKRCNHVFDCWQQYFPFLTSLFIIFKHKTKINREKGEIFEFSAFFARLIKNLSSVRSNKEEEKCC